MHLKTKSFLLLFILLCANIVHGQIRDIRKELHKLSSTKDSSSIVNSLNRLGKLYRTRNADSCFYYGMKAKRIATNIHYQKGQIEADHVIAFALFKQGLYAQSLELLGDILPYYQQVNNTEKIIRTYLDRVEVMNKGISDRAKITALLQKAIQTGKTLKKDSIMAEVYISYCNRNGSLSTDSVEYYLNKSIEIANRYKDENTINLNRMWQARLLILDGQSQKALPLVTKLLSDAQLIGNRSLEINSLFLMTGFYEDKPKIALDYHYKAYRVAQQSGDSYLQLYILNNALDVAKQINDKDEIINVYRELEKAMTADWEKSKIFMGDYVKYNTIENDNKLLSEKNARRAVWLLVISLSSAFIVLTIYLIMVRRNRKARSQIQALNDVANMQIVAMEEAKHQAVREEQQRLGQDLHDGLSSSIAAIKYQLETLLMDIDDTALKSKLNKLQAETERAYVAARNKSHEWFNTADEQQEQSFEKQIRLLTDMSLPDSRYDKNIQIDNNSLISVDTDTRITLLRIIQEAITNVIKHAKAKTVGILIYEEENILTLTINDDGIGLDEKKAKNMKSTVGLQSIRRRVKTLNGETKIQSNSKGTEITISIPLELS